MPNLDNIDLDQLAAKLADAATGAADEPTSPTAASPRNSGIQVGRKNSQLGVRCDDACARPRRTFYNTVLADKIFGTKY